MIIIACPGQGSQSPGFLSPWLSEPAFAEHLSELESSCQIPLTQHGTVSDAETIRDTSIAQPLIVAAGIMAFSALKSSLGLPDNVEHSKTFFDNFGTAGHSVGEITASVVSGVLSEKEAMLFVKKRAESMARATAENETGMCALIGGDSVDIQAFIEQHGLFVANINSSGQIVAAGDKKRLANLEASLPKGVRAIPLAVAGAFHTPFMKSAQREVAQTLATFRTNDPHCALWTNKDGSLVTDGAAMLQLLETQIVSPVRWDLCMKAFDKASVSAIIELAPGGTLVSLAKREFRSVPHVAIKTPDDLMAAKELIENVSRHALNTKE